MSPATLKFGLIILTLFPDMKNNMLDFALRIGTFQTDRWFTAVIGILFLLCLWGFLTQRLSKRDKKLFWIGCVAVVICFGLTLGLYHWRLPRGLAGQYFPNLSWTPAPAGELDRYFEADGTGRRVDRFIDFNSNDFNLHTFKVQPFSVEWQGFAYVPADGYHFNLESSFDTELFVDDTLAATSFEGAETIDFGTPKARQYLMKGWSFDESAGGARPFGFVWAANDDATLLVRVENERDYQLQFRCYPFSYPGSPQQEVSVFIGDAFVQQVVLQEGWQTYTLDIPKDVLEDVAPGSILLTFVFSQVAKPSEVLGSQDSRQLAAAFDVVSLRQKTHATPSQSPSQASNSAPGLSQGWYHLRVKAKTIANNRASHIQLTWGRGKQGRKSLVPEDVLFPEVRSFQAFLQRVHLERLFLYSLIAYKFLLFLFLVGWLWWVVLRPHAHLAFKKGVVFLFLICLLAFGVRVAFLMEKSVIDPHFYLIESGTDQANYVAYARGLFRGYWPGLTHTPFYFNVLNAFYIALTFVLCGENLFATRLISAGLSVTSIIFVYLIARRVFQRPVAYIAAILCACNGVLIFYDTSLIIAPLKIFLTLGALWLLITLQDKASWTTTLTAGVFLGLSALARATVFLFMPVALLWILWRMPATFSRKILHCLVLVCVMLATISPVTIRNYYSNDEHPFVLITGGVAGLNLWAANNPSSNGMFGYSPQLYQEVKARVKREETTFFNEVMTFVKEHPLDYLYLEYKKFKYFWRGYEPGNLLSYYFMRPRSNILSLPWLNFLIIGPLSLIGMFLAGKTWKRTWLLYGFVGMQMGLLLMFWVLARYRIVAVPILSIFAAYTIWFVIQALRQKRWFQGGMTIGVCLLVYVLVNYPDAAFDYQQHHGQQMPVSRVVRYWDLFEW
jgi:4-amino-4-deoxy-L-arabinose transferase-like glycosyltransferase